MASGARHGRGSPTAPPRRSPDDSRPDPPVPPRAGAARALRPPAAPERRRGRLDGVASDLLRTAGQGRLRADPRAPHGGHGVRWQLRLGRVFLELPRRHPGGALRHVRRLLRRALRPRRGEGRRPRRPARPRHGRPRQGARPLPRQLLPPPLFDGLGPRRRLPGIRLRRHADEDHGGLRARERGHVRLPVRVQRGQRRRRRGGQLVPTRRQQTLADAADRQHQGLGRAQRELDGGGLQRRRRPADRQRGQARHRDRDRGRLRLRLRAEDLRPAGPAREVPRGRRPHLLPRPQDQQPPGGRRHLLPGRHRPGQEHPRPAGRRRLLPLRRRVGDPLVPARPQWARLLRQRLPLRPPPHPRLGRLQRLQRRLQRDLRGQPRHLPEPRRHQLQRLPHLPGHARVLRRRRLTHGGRNRAQPARPLDGRAGPWCDAPCSSA